jgi:probable O-glycosylation ligase (exosortase A-associated)
MVGATANSKIRIHALIWVSVLSLLYWGSKGGVLTLQSGGTKTISGPLDSLIGDNNQLALSLLMILPLVSYLWRHSANRAVRIGLTTAGVLTFLSVLGSYSRGAYLALGALCVLGWLRSRKKLLYPILVAAIAYPALNFMPQHFYDRLDTVSSVNAAETDGSFQGRVLAWKVAYYYARDHFPFGAGFAGPQKPGIFNFYFPLESTHAAHSIYFQVLGEHGFIGLAFFLVILVLAFWNCQKIRKAASHHPDLAWARDLATMIQLSLLAYCIGGAALSMAYDDVAVIWFLLLPVLYRLVLQSQASQSEVSATRRPTFASAKTAALQERS